MQKLSWTGFAFGLTLLSLLPTAAVAAKSTFGLLPDGRLDQAAIAKAYKESEWEMIISTLQGYLRSKDEDAIALNEKIYAFKYLGVIFGADSASRSKAESYFTRLVELSPTVEIVDLFPSKRVTDLFSEVKQDYQKRKQYTQQYDVYGHKTGDGSQDAMAHAASGNSQTRKELNQALPKANRETPKFEDGNKTWVWWTLGLAAAVGAGVGVYVLTSKEEPAQDGGTTVDAR